VQRQAAAAATAETAPSSLVCSNIQVAQVANFIKASSAGSGTTPTPLAGGGPQGARSPGRCVARCRKQLLQLRRQAQAPSKASRQADSKAWQPWQQRRPARTGWHSDCERSST
jgi:hypothetical protein